MSRQTEIINEINKYLPSWGGYKLIKYMHDGTEFYDMIIEADFSLTDNLKIRTTSTNKLHCLEQALKLLELWVYEGCC